MDKIAVSNYQYLELLVRKIKSLHYENKDYNWYFDELLLLYNPLVQSSTRRVYNKFKSNVNFIDIKLKVIEILFDTILRYEPTFTDNGKHCKDGDNFKFVYFSNYLKRKLNWDLMRLYKPTRIDYDDLCYNPKFVEFTSCHNTTLVCDNEAPMISENFIFLCKKAQKDLQNDVLSDTMMLQYGYGYKPSEIAEFFGTTSLKIHAYLAELKKYWLHNKEALLP